MRGTVRTLLVLAAILAATACTAPEPPNTPAELRAAIEQYRAGDPSVTDERIGALFTRLDAAIATRRAEADAASGGARERLGEQVAALEGERRDLQQAWIAARLARLGTTAGEALRGLGESVGRGLEDAGRQLRESLQQGRPREGGTPPPR